MFVLYRVFANPAFGCHNMPINDDDDDDDDAFSAHLFGCSLPRRSSMHAIRDLQLRDLGARSVLTGGCHNNCASTLVGFNGKRRRRTTTSSTAKLTA